jgi:hypothetical protein
VPLLVSLQLDLLSEHYETVRHDLADEQAATEQLVRCTTSQRLVIAAW